MSDPVVVYTTDSLHQANTLAMFLNAEGIKAVVWNSDVHTFGGIFQTDWAAPRVVVPGDQVTKAAELVRDFEEKQLARPAAMSLLPQDQLPPAEYVDDDEDGEHTFDAHIWPKCPECQEPRPTQCPYCKHSGSDFNAAYGTDSEEEWKVVCPTCDEPFRPTFFRRCHGCGHDFGDGKQEPTVERDKQLDLNWRVPATFVVILLAIVAVIAYFSALFGQLK